MLYWGIIGDFQRRKNEIIWSTDSLGKEYFRRETSVGGLLSSINRRGRIDDMSYNHHKRNIFNNSSRTDLEIIFPHKSFNLNILN